MRKPADTAQSVTPPTDRTADAGAQEPGTCSASVFVGLGKFPQGCAPTARMIDGPVDVYESPITALWTGWYYVNEGRRFYCKGDVISDPAEYVC